MFGASDLELERERPRDGRVRLRIENVLETEGMSGMEGYSGRRSQECDLGKVGCGRCSGMDSGSCGSLREILVAWTRVIILMMVKF